MCWATGWWTGIWSSWRAGAGRTRCGRWLGLRFDDVQVADRRLVVVAGKGGHHRVVPAANRFFDALGGYLHGEQPAAAATDRVFVVLKGPRRGLPLSAEGLDEVLDGARRRAGLAHATCHELRHTCPSRLREAGNRAPTRPMIGRFAGRRPLQLRPEVAVMAQGGLGAGPVAGMPGGRARLPGLAAARM